MAGGVRAGLFALADVHRRGIDRWRHDARTVDPERDDPGRGARRGRRCCAAARSRRFDLGLRPAGRCGVGAGACAGACRVEQPTSLRHANVRCCCRHRALRWASGCAVWRPRRSIFPTASTGDLGHVLHASGVGAEIELAAIPRGVAMDRLLVGAQRELALRCLLAGGDDYELCFTVPSGCARELTTLRGELGLALARIGSIESHAGMIVRDEPAVNSQRCRAVSTISRHDARQARRRCDSCSPIRRIFLRSGSVPGCRRSRRGLSVRWSRCRLPRLLRAYANDARIWCAVVVAFAVGVWAAGRTGRDLGVGRSRRDRVG